MRLGANNPFMPTGANPEFSLYPHTGLVPGFSDLDQQESSGQNDSYQEPSQPNIQIISAQTPSVGGSLFHAPRGQQVNDIRIPNLPFSVLGEANSHRYGNFHLAHEPQEALISSLVNYAGIAYDPFQYGVSFFQPGQLNFTNALVLRAIDPPSSFEWRDYFRSAQGTQQAFSGRAQRLRLSAGLASGSVQFKNGWHTDARLNLGPYAFGFKWNAHNPFSLTPYARVGSNGIRASLYLSPRPWSGLYDRMSVNIDNYTRYLTSCGTSLDLEMNRSQSIEYRNHLRNGNYAQATEYILTTFPNLEERLGSDRARQQIARMNRSLGFSSNPNLRGIASLPNIYLMESYLGYSLSGLALYLGLDPTTPINKFLIHGSVMFSGEMLVETMASSQMGPSLLSNRGLLGRSLAIGAGVAGMSWFFDQQLDRHGHQLGVSSFDDRVRGFAQIGATAAAYGAINSTARHGFRLATEVTSLGDDVARLTAEGFTLGSVGHQTATSAAEVASELAAVSESASTATSTTTVAASSSARSQLSRLLGRALNNAAVRGLITVDLVRHIPQISGQLATFLQNLFSGANLAERLYNSHYLQALTQAMQERVDIALTPEWLDRWLASSFNVHTLGGLNILSRIFGETSNFQQALNEIVERADQIFSHQAKELSQNTRSIILKACLDCLDTQNPALPNSEAFAEGIEAIFDGFKPQERRAFIQMLMAYQNADPLIEMFLSVIDNRSGDVVVDSNEKVSELTLLALNHLKAETHHTISQHFKNYENAVIPFLNDSPEFFFPDEIENSQARRQCRNDLAYEFLAQVGLGDSPNFGPPALAYELLETFEFPAYELASIRLMNALYQLIESESERESTPTSSGVLASL